MSSPQRFRARAALLGIVLIPVNSLWIARAEALDYSGFPTCMSLFYNVIFSLMILLLANALVRRFLPRQALTQQELLVVYGMLATGSSLVGHDYLQMLVPTIPHAAYFATPENNWDNTIRPLLPGWLTIRHVDDAVRNYERGFSTLYRWEHISIWLVPMAAWSVFLLAVIGATLSMCVLLRRHWVQNERLAYPIVQIPLLMTQEGSATPLFRNRLFWAGAALAAGIDALNGLQFFYPALPSIPVKIKDIGPLFAAHPPWNAIGWLPLSFYPFAIGLSFFMPTRLAFSGLFFYAARKGQQVATAAMGYHDTDAWFPYLREQAYGAWIALFAASLWFGRRYIRELVRATAARGSAGDGGLSYRGVLALFAGCVLTMTVFLIAAGMKPWLGVTYVVLYILFCGAAARVRAELGPPAHEMGWVGTSYMMVMALGTAAVGPKSLALFSMLHFQNRMHRGLLMPQQAESLKAASESGLKIRIMALCLGLAGVIGILAAFWALIHLSYGRHYAASGHPGALGSAFAGEHFQQLSSWLSSPVKPSRAGLNAVLIGGAAALLLARASTIFWGFPFHPVGYALGTAFGLDYIWMPIFISWVIKVVTLRYGGLKGYRTMIPFFVGLVLGEFFVGGLWSFLRGILGVQTYTFYI
ncbi:MAG: hypothetical protein IT210_22550 [Armatimonadetes bacterium]|nr:hypothetical protein [Armatimonadota bacterium]